MRGAIIVVYGLFLMDKADLGEEHASPKIADANAALLPTENGHYDEESSDEEDIKVATLRGGWVGGGEGVVGKGGTDNRIQRILSFVPGSRGRVFHPRIYISI